MKHGVTVYTCYCRPNKKRQAKDKKFGFGGQKKRSKQNTRASTNDTSEFNVKKHNTRPGKKGKVKTYNFYRHALSLKCLNCQDNLTHPLSQLPGDSYYAVSSRLAIDTRIEFFFSLSTQHKKDVSNYLLWTLRVLYVATKLFKILNYNFFLQKQRPGKKRRQTSKNRKKW